MAYQVLARRWRPQVFDDLLGQEAVVRTLQNALATGTLGHAYLFSGLRGVGKTTAARLLAKAVNCSQGPTPSPCGECVSCREVAEGSSIDVVELDAATHTGVDDVRDLQELLRFRPTRDRFRVVIVDEVHMLSKSAFNALLKSIEEPPPYVLWIFATTERHRVPATILSRCQQLEFRPVASEVISGRLLEIAQAEGISVASSAAETIARAAEGSVRDALSLLDQLRAFSDDRIDDDAVATVLGVPRLDVVVELIGSLVDGDVAAGLDIIRRELVSGRDATVLYQESGRVLRTLTHLAVAGDLEDTLGDDQRALLRPLADRLGPDGLCRMLGLWLEQEALLRDAANRELALEVAALRLARWPFVQRVEALLETGGESSSQTGPSSGKTETRPAGDRTAGAGAAARLAESLWDDQPRIASAVEHAEVTREGDAVVLRVEPSSQGLARFLTASRERLEAACHELYPDIKSVRIEVPEEPSTAADSGSELQRQALEDPQVKLARKILGGEMVAVRPHREVE